MIRMSGIMASIFLAVSARVSPLVVLLVEAEILKVSALILLAAISKERRVRVLGSKKRVTTVLPRRTGTFEDELDVGNGEVIEAENVFMGKKVLAAHTGPLFMPYPNF
jgi:hypothetical protein